MTSAFKPEKREPRADLLALPPGWQERKVLDAFEYYQEGLWRDWFAVELRPAFDRLLQKGFIEPENTFKLTEAGKAQLCTYDE